MAGTVESANLIDGQIVIVRRLKSGVMLMCHPPRPKPDTVWKEVYGVVDGKIALIEKIPGRHEPARQVAELIVFDEVKPAVGEV